MATLKIEQLSKTYDEVEALKNVDLDVGDGEFFVILGPSGAGKTTMLKSVAGLQEIDSGSVTIGGVSMDGVEPYHRNVAMAFESYALYPQKTVFQNLSSPLRSGRTGKYSEQDQQQRIDQVTTTLGINHLQKRFPRELSNGQRQRVALGRVLVRPADIYLLDEPLSHLDAKLRATMRAELKNLGAMSKTTTLYVTHDYQEALALGDRIAVLRAGEIVQVGTPKQIWLDPVDSFVARALGQPEINLVSAVVDNGRLVGANGAISLPAASHLGVNRGDVVRLGLRPRDLDLIREGETAPAGDWATVPGTVRLAERLGRLIELSIDVNGTELILVADSDKAAVEGSRVHVAIPLAFAHVFAATDNAEDDSPRLGGVLAEHPDLDLSTPDDDLAKKA